MTRIYSYTLNWLSDRFASLSIMISISTCSFTEILMKLYLFLFLSYIIVFFCCKINVSLATIKLFCLLYCPVLGCQAKQPLYTPSTHKLMPMPMASVATITLQGLAGSLNLSACSIFVAGGKPAAVWGHSFSLFLLLRLFLCYTFILLQSIYKFCLLFHCSRENALQSKSISVLNGKKR